MWRRRADHLIPVQINTSLFPLFLFLFLLLLHLILPSYHLFYTMSDLATVHVSGISPGTTDKEVEDFFSFWYVYLS